MEFQKRQKKVEKGANMGESRAGLRRGHGSWGIYSNGHPIRLWWAWSTGSWKCIEKLSLIRSQAKSHGKIGQVWRGVLEMANGRFQKNQDRSADGVTAWEQLQMMQRNQHYQKIPVPDIFSDGGRQQTPQSDPTHKQREISLLPNRLKLNAKCWLQWCPSSPLSFNPIPSSPLHSPFPLFPSCAALTPFHWHAP